MYQIIESRVATGKTKQEKINLLREFLQVVVLKILSDMGAFKSIVFTGGTALRIVYQLQRYSEDLDFSLYHKEGYSFPQILKKLKYELEHLGFSVEISYKENVVNSAFIKFKTLLSELGLSDHVQENLSIKLEIDTNPPQGGTIEQQIINDIYLFPIKIYNLPSLFAGKLHAVFRRRYNKGRDWYDLLWYLSKHIKPDTQLLTTATYQTEKKQINFLDGKWKLLLNDKIQQINFKELIQDIAPFLMNSSEQEFFTQETFLNLLKKN